MSNISQDAGAQERANPSRIAGKEARAILERLVEQFPKAFMREDYLRKPLKLGVHKDLQARCPQLSAHERSAVLRYYVSGPGYLRASVEGAPRIDLDGNASGAVTAEAAQHAGEKLTAMLAAREQRIRKHQPKRPQQDNRRAEQKPKEEKPLAPPPSTPKRASLSELREAGRKLRGPQ